MGVVGFFMMLMNIPAAPFLIAFILGPMFEDNLRRALAISRGNPNIFFQSTISWIFFVLIILFVGITARREWRSFRAKKSANATGSDLPGVSS